MHGNRTPVGVVVDANGDTPDMRSGQRKKQYPNQQIFCPNTS